MNPTIFVSTMCAEVITSQFGNDSNQDLRNDIAEYQNISFAVGLFRDEVYSVQ